MPTKQGCFVYEALTGIHPGGTDVSASDMLIIGASARAAAFSVLRVGCRPACIDLFADADLQARCSTIRLETNQYPRGFETALGHLGFAFSSIPWMYTGGLESHPRLVERLASRLGPLLGNPGPVLRAVRDPLAVHAQLTATGIPCPAVRRITNQSELYGRWLLKPLCGAGGSGISHWSGALHSSTRCFLQEYIEGESCSALFAAHGGTTHLLGATRQLVGEEWLHAGPFAYCGSVGPLASSVSLEARLRELGIALGRAFGLRGLFGVDFILRDEVPWPVEINPRWTASAEIVEAATGVNAFSAHRLAASGTGDSIHRFALGQRTRNDESERSLCVGKAILFAKERVTFPDQGAWSDALRTQDAFPAFADIPHPGEIIETHHPVLTFFAQANSPTVCLTRLQSIAATLDHCLFGG
jgi:predicted ATP-grasp superfamily ATP-dependent carboligase